MRFVVAAAADVGADAVVLETAGILAAVLETLETAAVALGTAGTAAFVVPDVFAAIAIAAVAR